MTIRSDARPTADAYLGHSRDAVRETFERAFFDAEVGRLLDEASGSRLLDLGCGDGLVADLVGDRLDEYVGVDLNTPNDTGDATFVAHDLIDGLGPVGPEPFDLYLGTFGVVSHLPPANLEQLCREIAAHARPGSLVALEALGLLSLEWPGLWEVPQGPDRALPYRLAGETEVHPWAAAELEHVFDSAGIEPLRTVDRSVQAGPKVGEDRYWPGLPAVRAALNALVEGNADGLDELQAPLPPLPAHPAARVHHDLVERRRQLLGAGGERSPQELARAIWALEPATGGGYGHGLLVVGRVA